MGAERAKAAEQRALTRLRPVLAVVVGFGFGAVPFSNLMAQWRLGVDLRSVGNGTVSGTALWEVAGDGPLVVAGLFELAKGAAGPLLAGRSHPVAAALAGGAAVAGHNWSPFLGGAGGRGISPAMGSLLVTAPIGSAVLMGGLIGGRLAGETALGSLLADLALVPAAARVHGRQGLLAGLAVVVPMVAKRLSGNAPVKNGNPLTYVNRLLFDRDSRAEAPGPMREEAS
jgi:glycerol-3-phosphate acyltransferase PlsY